MKIKTVLFPLLLLLLAGFLSASAQTAIIAGEKAKTADEAELRLQTFEKVWTTVNENHFDPTFGGVDWKKVRADYEPRARAAQTDAELYAVLRQMLGELKLSHFGIFPPRPDALEKTESGGAIGIGLKMIDGEAVISRVENESSAERVGLKTGFVIEKIDDKTTVEILAPVEKILIEQTTDENLKKIYRERALLATLNGKPATNVKIEVLDDANKSQTFDVERRATASEMSPAFGNFPPQEIVFESKKLVGNVGYIRFNIWMIPQMAKIREAVRAFADVRGIIFDLRGNPGGIGGLATGVAGLLVKERISLGSMRSRSGEQNFIVYPQPDSFAGKVVILSDYGTGSTSEVFAAGMQDAGRAEIVGERSAGAVLPSIIVKLPTGALFQYPISDYKSPRQVLVEGRGVAPDVEVKTTRAMLLAGRDLPLEAAVKEILK